VQGVVSPIESVGGGDRLNAFLLSLAIRRQRRQVARGRLLLLPAFLNGGYVVDRQKVHGVHAGLCQGLQVLIPALVALVKAR